MSEMTKMAAPSFRRAGVVDVPEIQAPPPSGLRLAWMPFLSVVLLSLSFAPVGQFYLAWIGLVPWILFVHRVRSTSAAFWWSWAAGWVFFLVNIWWLGFVTWPGTIAVCCYMGLYWGLAALLTRWILRRTYEDGGSRTEDGKAAARRAPSSILDPLSTLWQILGIATVWTAGEWVRGNLLSGFPWSFLGHGQTPLLPLVQIADVTGVYGVTFLIVAVNACAALYAIERMRVRAIVPAVVGVAALLAMSLGYGAFRLFETSRSLSPGPTVMVVQCNFPQSNTGRKGASQQDFVQFHLDTTRQALEEARAAGRRVDLVGWSETTMPAINREARRLLLDYVGGGFNEETFQALAQLAGEFRVGLLTGGNYFDRFHKTPEGDVPTGNRNSAYYFEPSGLFSDKRYDKIHLVPFGEYIPFKQTIPWLYRFFLAMSPYNYDHTIHPGDDHALTVFELPASNIPPGEAPLRFVVPICFEDADSRLVARMFRPTGHTRQAKRSDLILNITNDGWFSQPQLSQHLQIARFRSIENRAPTARAVNTGISAFIDSAGRIVKRLPTHVEGVATETLSLDSRLTLYTRFGDWFAGTCTVVTAVLAGWALWRRRVEH